MWRELRATGRGGGKPSDGTSEIQIEKQSPPYLSLQFPPPPYEPMSALPMMRNLFTIDWTPASRFGSTIGMNLTTSSARHSAPKSARKPARITPQKGSGAITIGFTSLYRHQERPMTKTDPNGRRLAAVIKMFGISPSAVAKAANVSQSYISRLLNPSDPFVGSADFYRRLETVLGKLIEQRQQQFFTVPAVAVRSIENAVRDVVDLAA